MDGNPPGGPGGLQPTTPGEMAMYLVQLLLPLNDNDGQRLSGALF